MSSGRNEREYQRALEAEALLVGEPNELLAAEQLRARLTTRTAVPIVRHMQTDCNRRHRVQALAAALCVAISAGACGDDGDGHSHDNEVISLVELTFTPTGGGTPLVFEFTDPDGDGGVSGMADPIDLAAGVEYTLGVRFVNTLAEPAEDLTEEVKEEAEDHLVFILGDVSGPASMASTVLVTHAYADKESDYTTNAVGDDLPVGIRSTITTKDPGEGQLRVMLRHLPELNGAPQKSGDLPRELAEGKDLPGSPDVDVSFDLVVM